MPHLPAPPSPRLRRPLTPCQWTRMNLARDSSLSPGGLGVDPFACGFGLVPGPGLVVGEGCGAGVAPRDFACEALHWRIWGNADPQSVAGVPGPRT